MFKVGDKVVCVYPNTGAGYLGLVEGEVYTVEYVSSHGEMLYVKGFDYGWFQSRFAPFKSETKPEDYNVNDLRAVVDSLRQQGYTVTVSLTAPVVTEEI